MGTPRSSDGWVVLALAFSGREDPSWPAPQALVSRAMALWDAAAPAKAVAAPPLGYRGCALRAPDGRAFVAFGGTMTLTTPGTRAETRRDDGRALERLLLDSAPAGLLPPGLVV